MDLKNLKDKYLITNDIGDSHDYVGANYHIDPGYVRTQLDQAIAIGTHDPLSAVSSAVNTGTAVTDFLSGISPIVSSAASAQVNLGSAISALGELDRPYNSLAGIPSFEPYLSSITSLASASSVASTIKGLADISSAGILSTNNKFADLGVSALGLTAHSPVVSSLSASVLAETLAPTALASTRAVLGLETAYARLGTTDFAALGNFPSSQIPSYISALHDGVSSLTAAAKTAWDTIALRPEDISTTSLYMARAPGIEVYTASQAAAVISLPVKEFPPIDNDIEEFIDTAVDEFEERLFALAPSLKEMYRGAIETMERGGPDWRRQAMVSFRELTSHVMHMLAPDERVKPWAKSEHFDKGRLTRRARLEYIFESIAGGEFTNFFKADLKASIELFDLLNNGTHRLTSTATPEQLRYLKGRVVNLVSVMLEARGH
jgi:hypothetical protein